MLQSRYNFIDNRLDTHGFCVVYNANSGSILKIDDSNTMNSLLSDEISQIDKATQQLLEKNKIIVSSHEQEFEEIKERYEKSIMSTEELFLTLMPTEACNFACPYCFVYEKTAGSMTSETYERILCEVKNKLKENSNLKTIYLNWFGGEPSLCLDQIISFSKQLTHLSKSFQAKTIGSITTNGYLIDKQAFIRLLDVGITNIQITIDGTQKIHDAVRYLRNGEGTFSTIWDNIHNISQIPFNRNFHLDIRCNFRQSTLSSVYELIDLFISEFPNDPRLNIYCRPVYHYETKSNAIESLKEDIMSIDDGIRQQNRFARYIQRKRGSASRRLFDPLPQPTNCWCNAEKKMHLIIGPHGEYYVCDTLTGSDYTIGFLNGAKHQSRESWLKYNIFSDERTSSCPKCKLLPICMGGCMRNRLDNSAKCYWTEANIIEALKEYVDQLIDEKVCIHSTYQASHD